MATRWFDKYLQTYMANPGQNDAEAYGVEIVHSVAPQRGDTWFKVIGVHHLTGAENGGQHNVFCEVLDEEGKRIQGVILIAANINNAVSHVRADKPDNEPAASIPMWGNDMLTVQVAGLTLSEKVRGLHTRHADEGSGNTLGHHSFLIVWQKRSEGHTPTPQPEPDPQPQPSWLSELERRAVELLELIRTNT